MKKHKDKPFAVVGVNVGGTAVGKLAEVMAKEELPWRSFADLGQAGHGPIATSWNLIGTPRLYVIDSRGVIRHKWVGAPGERTIDAALEALIREAEGNRR